MSIQTTLRTSPQEELPGNASRITSTSVLNTHSVSPFAALKDLVKTSSGRKPAAVLQEGQLSAEVFALCKLLARILMRCLREHNDQTLQTLSLRLQHNRQITGGKHDPAE